MIDVLRHLAVILGFVLALLLVARILQRHERPASSIAWLVSIIAAPHLAVPAYLIFGGRKIARMAASKERLFGPDTAPSLRPDAHPVEKLLCGYGLPFESSLNDATLLTDGKKAYELLLEQIDSARESIEIMTFILGTDAVGREFIRRLAVKADEGVRVRALRSLTAAGAAVHLHPGRMIHAKHVLVDSSVAISGSANMDYRSMYINYEIATFCFSGPYLSHTVQWIERLRTECSHTLSAHTSAAKRLAEDVAWLMSPLM